MNELQRFKALQQQIYHSIQPAPQLSPFEQQGLRMLEDMDLRGLSERTQESYIRAIRQLAEYCQKPPDQVSDEELRQYFLYQATVRKLSPVAIRISLCGIKFFFDNTIQRPWPTLRLIRIRSEKKMPEILSRTEVWVILSHVRVPIYRVCLQTIYTCGLRLSEGVRLQVSDIDSSRKMVHIRKAKGGRDRYVPLPEGTLLALRQSWKTHRNPVWLFPACGRGGIHRPVADKPMPYCNLQDAFRAAVKEAGIKKHATVHTLRHSYATHLLENGVHLRQIQEYLGHTSPKTTAIYTHLTEISEQQSRKVIDGLMEGL
jgi:site-specific recombinase XerD